MYIIRIRCLLPNYIQSTCPLKIDGWKMKLPFKMVSFSENFGSSLRGYVYVHVTWKFLEFPPHLVQLLNPQELLILPGCTTLYKKKHVRLNSISFPKIDVPPSHPFLRVLPLIFGNNIHVSIHQIHQTFGKQPFWSEPFPQFFCFLSNEKTASDFFKAPFESTPTPPSATRGVSQPPGVCFFKAENDILEIEKESGQFIGVISYNSIYRDNLMTPDLPYLIWPIYYESLT